MRIGPFSQWGDIGITAAKGSLWVRTSNKTVTRINPTTHKAIARYPATGGGGGIAVAFGSLWIASAGNDRLLREAIHAHR